MLQLLRFNYNGTKNNSAVEFGESFILNDYLSDQHHKTIDGNVFANLCAVIVHHGTSIDSGHFICYVRHDDGDNNVYWMCMDDLNPLKKVSYLCFFFNALFSMFFDLLFFIF